jgi:hypothetical protein
MRAKDSLPSRRASHLFNLAPPLTTSPKEPCLTMISYIAVLSLLSSLLPVSSLIGSYCNDDGSSNVAAQGDFQFNSIVFSNKFQSKCSCTNSTLQCQNECETCFRGVCGVLETSQDERRQAEASTSVVPVSNYSLCMTYTGGRVPSIGGKTCFTYDAAAATNTTDPDGSKICEMSYNGESCTWCKMYVSGCIRANCTNILADARVNTCWTDAWQGIEQQFRLAALVNNITAVQETRLGRCGYSDLDNIKLQGDDASLQIDPPATTAEKDADDEPDTSSDPSSKSQGQLAFCSSWTIAIATWLILVVLS